MTSREAEPRPGEFALIAKLFAPLAKSVPGAFGLTDDVAVIAPLAGHEMVLKTDSLIESVHFLRGDPAAMVAQKALRRALSDLAAKAAEPSAYLLALALPQWPDLAWLESFANGLASDQAAFRIALAGGETNSTPGPLTINVTAIGHVRQGALIRRNGATIGDGVFVTGTIGDAGAGLELATERANSVSDPGRDFLLSRYRLPLPRLAFGRLLQGTAAASIDVSDGLLADLAHIAETSHVRVEIQSADLPLSGPLREFWGEDERARVRAATAGDDYEIVFTAPLSGLESLRAASRRTATPCTEIGRVTAGEGVALLDRGGREISVDRKGYTHF